jgi:hypothetical protein
MVITKTVGTCLYCLAVFCCDRAGKLVMTIHELWQLGGGSVWHLKIQCFIFIRFFSCSVLVFYDIIQCEEGKTCMALEARAHPLYSITPSASRTSAHTSTSTHPPTHPIATARQTAWHIHTVVAIERIWNLNLILSVCWKIHFVLTRRPNWLFCSAWGMGCAGWECRGGERGLGGRSWKKLLLISVI